MDTKTGSSARKHMAIVLVIFAVSAIVVPGQAAANPIVINEGMTITEAVVLLLFLNFPVDLLWFAAMSYLVVWRWGREAGRLPDTKYEFVGMVIVASFLIAFFGMAIDLFAFYKWSPIAGVEFWPTHDELLFSAAAITALVLIFGSVYSVCVAVARYGKVVSLVPALAIAAMNPVMWIIAGEGTFLIHLIVSTLALVLAISVLFLLADLHVRRIPAAPVNE